MNRPGENQSFLDRESIVRLPLFGRLRNYHVIAVLLVLALPFITRGARFALERQMNDMRDWLPQSYDESVELRWFQQHFVSEQFALVSWDGCTLGNTEKLNLLARKLIAPRVKPAAEEPAAALAGDDPRRFFKSVLTGPGALEELTRPPLSLEYEEALERLEGALVGPLPEGSDDDADRTTCLIVTLSREGQADNRNKRAAIEAITFFATEHCEIPPDDLHLGGPPVDNVAIDIEGERTLLRLAGLSGIVGFGLSYLCFRSLKLTLFVFLVGVVSAGISLAAVRYFGMYEVLIAGLASPRFGTVDAILMSMPAVVYVLGISGAIHIVNYYRDVRRQGGTFNAAEAAVQHGWKPCTLAALTTSVGLGSLYISDITPIKKFGIFSAVGVLATLVILFSLLPVLLHRFPPKENQPEDKQPAKLPIYDIFMHRVAGFIIDRNGLVATVCLFVLAFSAYGLRFTQTRVQLLKLFDSEARIIADYTWLEEHLGNLVPMEVVLRIDPEHRRGGNQPAEAGGRAYRMNLLERMELVQTVQRRIEELEPVGRALSAATFGPELTEGGSGFGTSLVDPRRVANIQLERYAELHRRAAEETEATGEHYVVVFDAQENEALLMKQVDVDPSEKKFTIITEGDYRREEQMAAEDAADDEQQPERFRELYRISTRLSALSDVDYGRFVRTIRRQVEPVLQVYDWRDQVLARLHKQAKELSGSKTCILIDVEEGEPAAVEEDLAEQSSALAEIEGPPPSALAHPLRSAKLLHRLLKEAGARVQLFNLAQLGEKAADAGTRAQLSEFFGRFDCVLLVGRGDTVQVDPLVAEAPLVVDLDGRAGPDEGEEMAGAAASDAAQPAGISTVYTGIVPLVYKTQRQLLQSLIESSAVSCGLIALVMILVLRSIPAGLVSMLPNVFPIVLVFGSMAWLGVKVDIGIMMTASVALGVAVDDTVHFLTWFREGIRQGLGRQQATMLAYERCGTAMFQTTVIGGLGLAVFAFSTFTPTQQFGVLMVTLLSAALIGDLIFLPAMLCGPVGRFFSSSVDVDASGGDSTQREAGSWRADPQEDPPAGPEAEQDADRDQQSGSDALRPTMRRDAPHRSMRT